MNKTHFEILLQGMNTKTLIPISIIAVIIIIAVVWGVQNQGSNLQNQQENQVNQQVGDNPQDEVINNNDNQDEPEVITSDIDTSDWQTYRNEGLGFSFRYPGESENVEEVPNPGQIRITDPKFRATISYKSCEKDCSDVRPGLGLAVISQGVGGCEINLWHSFKLADKEITVSISRATHNDPNTINVSEEKCIEQWTGIDKDKISYGLHGGQSAYLPFSKIPESGKEAYRRFKTIINSFQEL